eukprot:1979888-Alexandrium_andersonii.AAC.1
MNAWSLASGEVVETLNSAAQLHLDDLLESDRCGLLTAAELEEIVNNFQMAVGLLATILKGHSERKSPCALFWFFPCASPTGAFGHDDRIP